MLYTSVFLQWTASCVLAPRCVPIILSMYMPLLLEHITYGYLEWLLMFESWYGYLEWLLLFEVMVWLFTVTVAVWVITYGYIQWLLLSELLHMAT